MIVYEPNKNFLRDIGHLARSWTMVKIMRAVFACGFFTTCLILIVHYFELNKDLIMETSAFSFLGIVLSILLVFRTNNAYDRWWEGRMQWGALVNNCRNCAVLIHAAFPRDDKESRHFLAVHISNFCIALKEHLRNGVVLDELIFLSDEELRIYSTKDHLPNYIAYQICQRIQDVFLSDGIRGEDHLNIKLHTQELLNIAGACERIKKTPIPFSYAVFIKIFILSYVLLLPVALLPTFGYWTIPLVMLIFFAFIGIEMLAEEIEDPFGLDCNDLPTGTIAHTIKQNVFELLEAKQSHNHEVQLYDKIF